MIGTIEGVSRVARRHRSRGGRRQIEMAEIKSESRRRPA
jgi:hypothetical protein